MSHDSIHEWMVRYADGDEEVADQVVDFYYDRLVRLAGKKLSSLPPQVADDEGAAVSALRSFFSGVRGREFDKLENRNDLWRVLATITARKAIRQIRVHRKARGEGDRVNRFADVQAMPSTEPSPVELAQLSDDFDQRLDALNDETLRSIALLRLQGYDTNHISKQLGVHVRTIQRKLSLIESQWLEAEDPDTS